MSVTTTDKYGIDLHDYAARVERTVRDNIPADHCYVLGMIELPINMDEERNYWERQYIVAWFRQNNGSMVNPITYGTHKCCINNEGESMIVWGHQPIKRANDAVISMIERASHSLNYGAALREAISHD